MAGGTISVELKGGRAITQALNKLLKQSSDLSPALGDVGEYLLQSTQQRFIDQQAPDGSPWAQLSSTTIELKQNRGKRLDRILTESSTLADSLNYQLTKDSLTLGSNMEYAAMHQFGGVTSPNSMMPNSEIPDRPFLGIAFFERAKIVDILNEHLSIS